MFTLIQINKITAGSVVYIFIYFATTVVLLIAGAVFLIKTSISDNLSPDFTPTNKGLIPMIVIPMMLLFIPLMGRWYSEMWIFGALLGAFIGLVLGKLPKFTTPKKIRKSIYIYTIIGIIIALICP